MAISEEMGNCNREKAHFRKYAGAGWEVSQTSTHEVRIPGNKKQALD
jgi:hypothetical protein